MHFSPRIHFPTNTSPAYASPLAPNPHTLSSRSTSYYDSETGFTFSETRAAATLTSNIIYRVAQPANVAPNTPYDIILQVIVPSTLGWVGLAWGGGMVRNPLTVGYPNGAKTPTVSSRWAAYVDFLLLLLLLLLLLRPFLSLSLIHIGYSKIKTITN